MKQRPHHLLLLTAVTFVLISFFVLNQNHVIDIHFHDTFFVIAPTYVFWLLAVLALFIWAPYLVTEKIMFSKVLTWTHVTITMLTLILFAMTLYFGENVSSLQPRHYYDYSTSNSFNGDDKYTKPIGILISILLYGQIIFAINFIAGLSKRKT